MTVKFMVPNYNLPLLPNTVNTGVCVVVKRWFSTMDEVGEIGKHSDDNFLADLGSDFPNILFVVRQLTPLLFLPVEYTCLELGLDNMQAPERAWTHLQFQVRRGSWPS